MKCSEVLLFLIALLFWSPLVYSWTPYADASEEPPIKGLIENERGWFEYKLFDVGKVKLWAIQLVQPKSVKAEEGDIWEGYSFLRHICSCESHGNPDKEPRQYEDDGLTLLWGRSPKTGKPVVGSDIGACQISLKYHQKRAESYGLDVINSLKHNIAFAKILFDERGWLPWKASKICWEKYNLLK